MGILTASVRELTNARALDVALVDANGDQLTTIDVNVLSTPAGAAPATAVITSVAGATINTVLLAANTARRKFHIFNDSIRTLKIAFGVDATATTFTILLPGQGSYESQLDDYKGVINGIWNIANGSARITELTN